MQGHRHGHAMGRVGMDVYLLLNAPEQITLQMFVEVMWWTTGDGEVGTRTSPPFTAPSRPTTLRSWGAVFSHTQWG